jgi:hypothetical protein
MNDEEMKQFQSIVIQEMTDYNTELEMLFNLGTISLVEYITRVMSIAVLIPIVVSHDDPIEKFSDMMTMVRVTI